MKKLNRKGFTLVELLAVIVILGIVMLIGVTAIGPLITNTRSNALKSEIDLLRQAAENEALLNTKINEKPTYVLYTDGSNKGDLNDYFDKKDAKYEGFVKVEFDSYGKATIKAICISDGANIAYVGSGDMKGDNAKLGTTTEGCIQKSGTSYTAVTTGLPS